jgi:glutamine synthetase
MLDDTLKKIDEKLKKVKEDEIEFVELEFSDMFGTLKSLEIPVEQLEDSLKKGTWFDGSSVKGFTRIMESDMYLMPDPDTYVVLKKGTARFICDVYTKENKIFEGAPRSVLKEVLKEAEEMGYTFNVGPEVEFFLFKKDEKGEPILPVSRDPSYFNGSTGDIGSIVRKEVMSELKKIGVSSEKAHHEVGVDQHEIGFKYGNALKTADTVMTLKRIIKTKAEEHDLIASFMPKPLYGMNGSGMHVHFSLFKDDKNAFYDASDKSKLSPTAKRFIAGILSHVKELSVLLSPTVNSYKRLVIGYEAPVYICWGGNNRSALVRIPHYVKGREKSVRGELRCPDPSASPYLVFSAMLKAGLDGIKKEMDLMPEMDDSVYDKSASELSALGIDVLPCSLEEALSYFKESELMKELLGDKLFNNYLNAKTKEADEFRTHVTEWEVKKYIMNC